MFEPRLDALPPAQIALWPELAAAAAIYGDEFNPMISLKAISYHGDPALADLPERVRRDLIAAVRGVDVARLPRFFPVRPRGARP